MRRSPAPVVVMFALSLFDQAAAALPPVTRAPAFWIRPILPCNSCFASPRSAGDGFRTSVTASLFQGYDEALYCPLGYCLRPRLQQPGFTGGRASFNECVGLKEGSADVTAGTFPCVSVSE